MERKKRREEEKRRKKRRVFKRLPISISFDSQVTLSEWIQSFSLPEFWGYSGFDFPQVFFGNLISFLIYFFFLCHFFFFFSSSTCHDLTFEAAPAKPSVSRSQRMRPCKAGKWWFHPPRTSQWRGDEGRSRRKNTQTGHVETKATWRKKGKEKAHVGGNKEAAWGGERKVSTWRKKKKKKKKEQRDKRDFVHQTALRVKDWGWCDQISWRPSCSGGSI